MSRNVQKSLKKCLRNIWMTLRLAIWCHSLKRVHHRQGAAQVRQPNLSCGSKVRGSIWDPHQVILIEVCHIPSIRCICPPELTRQVTATISIPSTCALEISYMLRNNKLIKKMILYTALIELVLCCDLRATFFSKNDMYCTNQQNKTIIDVKQVPNESNFVVVIRKQCTYIPNFVQNKKKRNCNKLDSVLIQKFSILGT